VKAVGEAQLELLDPLVRAYGQLDQNADAEREAMYSYRVSENRFGKNTVEVVPALEKGVVDCGITGTMPAYKAKWPEVTNTLYRLPVGFTVGLWVANASTWNKLSPDTRAFLQKEFKALEDKSWKMIEAETDERNAKRIVVVDEGWRSGGISAELGMRIVEQAFFELDAPIARVCTAEVPIPYPKHLEDAALPSVAGIVAAARALVSHES